MHSMETPITTDGNFYHNNYDIVKYSQRRAIQITDRQVQMNSDIKLSERTEVYYCFNSKGDNSMWSTINILQKSNHTSKTEYLAVYYMVNQWPLK